MNSILVFGFDISEASQIRRIRLMQAAGLDVSSAAMRRTNMNAGFVPDWPNVELAQTGNANMRQRLGAIVKSFAIMLRHRSKVKASDVLWARNFDMLMIAWLSRLTLLGLKKRPRIVYECLDIHGLFTKPGFVGRAMRAAERFLLWRIDLLVVSSPGFIRNYFEPQQGYDGPVALIENKISFRDVPPPRPQAKALPESERKPVIGWVGTLRCPPSFELLLGLAEKMQEDVRIHMAGIVHEHMLPDFQERVEAHDNIHFSGAYEYPDGLIDVYKNCDMVWSQDLWQAGANSDWLLPNRIYEASWNGCPSVALETTETGRYVKDHRLGFVLAKPTVECLEECIVNNWPQAVIDFSNDLLVRDRAAFEQTASDITSALQKVDLS